MCYITCIGKERTCCIVKKKRIVLKKRKKDKYTLQINLRV